MSVVIVEGKKRGAGRGLPVRRNTRGGTVAGGSIRSAAKALWNTHKPALQKIARDMVERHIDPHIAKMKYGAEALSARKKHFGFGVKKRRARRGGLLSPAGRRGGAMIPVRKP